MSHARLTVRRSSIGAGRFVGRNLIADTPRDARVFLTVEEVQVAHGPMAALDPIAKGQDEFGPRSGSWSLIGGPATAIAYAAGDGPLP